MSEIEQQQSTAYPTLGQSWGLVGYILLATIGFAIIFAIAVFIVMQDLEAVTRIAGNSLSNLILYSAPFLLVVWLALARKKRKDPEFKLVFSSLSPAKMARVALATWCIYFLIDPIVDLIPMPKFFQDLILQLLSDHSLPSILMLVIAAPIFEELLFRGIILDGLLKRYSPTKAIIWSAVLFGLVHLNPWQFLAALALGVFMGWVYYRTGSLLATIFIHFIANGTGVLLGWLLVPDPTKMITTREMVGSNTLYFGLLATDVVLLIFLLTGLKKQFSKPVQGVPAEL